MADYIERELALSHPFAKRITSIVLAFICALTLCGCRQADKVSYNMSKQADAFNVTRKITVVNIRDNTILYELIGNISLKNEGNNELTVLSEVSPGEYKKDFIYLSDWTTYIMQDVSGAYADQYHYEVNILPYLRGVGGNVRLDFEED